MIHIVPGLSCVLKWVIYSLFFCKIFSLRKIIMISVTSLLLTSKHCQGRWKMFITLSLNGLGFEFRVPNILQWIVANEMILNDDDKNFSMQKWPVEVLCLKFANGVILQYCISSKSLSLLMRFWAFRSSLSILEFSYQTYCKFNVQFI